MTRVGAKVFLVSIWIWLIAVGVTSVFADQQVADPLRPVAVVPFGRQVGTLPRVTAWLAVTMNPSLGSSTQGICANGTQPFQS